jgi:hypothetical protein
MKKLLLMSLVVALTVGVARADLTGTELRVWRGVTYEAWITMPQTVGTHDGRNLVAFDLIFVSTTDDHPVTVDLGLDKGKSLDYGIFGELHQHHAFNGGMTSPTLDGFTSGNMDSHFNLWDEYILTFYAPREDVDPTQVSDIPGGVVSAYNYLDEYAFGTYLRGYFNYAPGRPSGTPLRSADWNIAHLVTFADAIDYGFPNYQDNIRVKGEIGGLEIAETFDFYIVVPEPATMSLLALGGMAMLRRRTHG